MENQAAATRLKALRNKSKLSIQKIADILGMEIGKYRHYEERYKGNSLPAELVQKLLQAFEGRPDLQNEALGLIEISGPHMPRLEESPTVYVTELITEPTRIGDDPEVDIVIRSDGKRLTVNARVDREGVEKLIKKLQVASELLD